MNLLTPQLLIVNLLFIYLTGQAAMEAQISTGENWCGRRVTYFMRIEGGRAEGVVFLLAHLGFSKRGRVKGFGVELKEWGECVKQWEEAGGPQV